MISVALWTAIRSRARHGEAKQTMAPERGGDRQTGRRLLAHARPTRDQRTGPGPAVVAPYLHDIQHRVTEGDDNAYRLFQAVNAPGYSGGEELGKRAVRPLRVARERRREATGRFETPATPPRPRGVGAWLGAGPEVAIRELAV